MKRILSLSILTLSLATLANQQPDYREGWPFLCNAKLYGIDFDADHVYLSSQQHLFCLDKAAGSVRWTVEKKGRTMGAPLVIGDKLISRSYRQLTARTGETGDICWEAPLYANSLKQALDAPRLYAGSSHCLLELSEKNGIPRQLYAGVGHTADFAVNNTYATLLQANVFDPSSMAAGYNLRVFRKGEKTPLWTKTLTKKHSLMDCTEKLALILTGTALQAFNLCDGSPAWKTAIGDIHPAWTKASEDKLYPMRITLHGNHCIVVLRGGDWGDEFRASPPPEQGWSNQSYLVAALDASTGKLLWKKLMPSNPLNLDVEGQHLVIASDRFNIVRIIDLKSGKRINHFALPQGKEIGLPSGISFAAVNDGFLYAGGGDGYLWRVSIEDMMRSNHWKGVVAYDPPPPDPDLTATVKLGGPNTYNANTGFEAIHGSVDLGRHTEGINLLFEFYRDGKSVHSVKQFLSDRTDDTESLSYSLYLGGLSYRPEYRQTETYNVLNKHKQAVAGLLDLKLLTIYKNHIRMPSFTSNQAHSYSREHLDLSRGYYAHAFTEGRWHDDKMAVGALVTRKTNEFIAWTDLKNLADLRKKYPEGNYLVVSVTRGNSGSPPEKQQD